MVIFIRGFSDSFGELLRKRRFENNLIAKELASAIGVTEDTILNWEKSRSHPPLEKILLLKETLNIDPSELLEYDGALTERQRAIINLIIEKGTITRSECQKLLGLRQQYAQNDLSFLFKLGVLGRKIGARRKATYFLPKDSED